MLSALNVDMSNVLVEFAGNCTLENIYPMFVMLEPLNDDDNDVNFVAPENIDAALRIDAPVNASGKLVSDVQFTNIFDALVMDAPVNDSGSDVNA